MPTQVTIQSTKVYLSQAEDQEAAIADARSGSLKPIRIQENASTSAVQTPVVTTRTMTTAQPAPASNHPATPPE